MKLKDILIRNHITIIGEGPQTIVMAHGFGCDQKMWQYILPFFEKSYRIVLFDYVGSGSSDLNAYNNQKYNSLHGYKQDLLEVLEALELSNVIYFGHSVSAMIGLLAANEKPHYFKQLIMIGPSPRYLNDVDYHGGFDKNDIEELLSMMEMNFLGWASFMAPYAMGVESKNELTEVLSESFRTINPVVARQFAEATFYSDHREDIAKCQTNALIIQCSEDSIVPVEVGNYLHKHIPNSALHIMDVKGHYPHISKPKLISEIVLRYIQQNTKENSYA